MTPINEPPKDWYDKGWEPKVWHNDDTVLDGPTHKDLGQIFTAAQDFIAAARAVTVTLLEDTSETLSRWASSIKGTE